MNEPDPAEQAPYARLTPDLMLDALDAVGLRGDGRFIALNSYENRVYQVSLEDGPAVVAKFYRPARWSDAQILEEHAFATELAGREIPVVAPPAGSDVYLIARLWSFWPILELEKDKTYRLHLTSLDYNHGFSLQPSNINIQVVPGYEHVLTVTPNQSGEFSIVCNEYCGLGHHMMVSRLYVR